MRSDCEYKHGVNEMKFETAARNKSKKNLQVYKNNIG